MDIQYEDTRPQPDPVHTIEETHDPVLETRLEENERREQGLMMEQLSKMLLTVQYHWYPHGQHHRLV